MLCAECAVQGGQGDGGRRGVWATLPANEVAAQLHGACATPYQYAAEPTRALAAVESLRARQRSLWNS